MIWGEVATWTGAQDGDQVIWGTTIYNPSGQQVIWGTDDMGGDQVSVFMAVPCDEKGEVDGDTQDEFQELADDRFLAVRPDAELA